MVIEDDQFTRTLIHGMLSKSNFEVVEFEQAAPALAALAEVDPHVLITDLDLGDGPTGVDVLRTVYEHAPWIATVVLTSHRSPILVDPQSFSLDPQTVYLVKNDVTSAHVLAEAIQAALHGERYAIPRQGDPVRLTRDQADILRLVANGLTNAEIAEARNTKIRAVEALLRRTFDALGFTEHDVAQARVPAARMYLGSQVDAK